MAGFRKNLKLFTITKNRLKMKNQREGIEAITVKALKECLWFKLPAKKCFTSNRSSNDKSSSKLAVV